MKTILIILLILSLQTFSLFAETGYRTDKDGNRYQVTFDLRDRFILGFKWSPYLLQGDDPETSQLTIDLGLHTYLYKKYSSTRYRFKIMDGEISLNPGQLDLTVFSFDRSNNERKPIFWITTFWGGTPKRHNVYADGGQAFSLMRIIWRPMYARDYTELELLSYLSSSDLWNSKDMMNFFRLRYGASLTALHHKSDDFGWHHDVNIKVIMEGWFVLDHSGLHHLRIVVEGAYPIHLDETDRYTGIYGEAKLSYEHAFIAISDQPLSLYFEIGARYRKGIPGTPDELQVRAATGMRFSFWAPPLIRSN